MCSRLHRFLGNLCNIDDFVKSLRKERFEDREDSRVHPLWMDPNNRERVDFEPVRALMLEAESTKACV